MDEVIIIEYNNDEGLYHKNRNNNYNYYIIYDIKQKKLILDFYMILYKYTMNKNQKIIYNNNIQSNNILLKQFRKDIQKILDKFNDLNFKEIVNIKEDKSIKKINLKYISNVSNHSYLLTDFKNMISNFKNIKDNYIISYKTSNININKKIENKIIKNDCYLTIEEKIIHNNKDKQLLEIEIFFDDKFNNDKSNDKLKEIMEISIIINDSDNNKHIIIGIDIIEKTYNITIFDKDKNLNEEYFIIDDLFLHKIIKFLERCIFNSIVKRQSIYDIITKFNYKIMNKLKIVNFLI